MASVSHRAAGIFIAHNLPSGDPTPSAADARVTRELAEVGRSLGLPLHDHLIIGESSWVSMRERGFIAA